MKIINAVMGMVALGLVGAAMGEVTIAEDLRLDADTDWSGRGLVTVDAGVTVDLNGHRLTVDNLTGTGRVIDTAPYDVLDGITATAEGQQWIDTDVVPGTTTAIAHDFTSGPIADVQVFFGCGYGYRVYLLVAQGTPFRWFGGYTTVCNIEAGVHYLATVTTDKIVKLVKADGTPVGSLTNQDLTSNGGRLYFFRGGNNGFYGAYTLHGSKIWQNNVLVRDFIPVRKRANGEVGLLDRVNMKFYANQSSTPFSYSDDNIQEGSDGVGEICIKYANGTQVANDGLVVSDAVKMALDLSACTESVAAPSAFWGSRITL